ncbi:hypothetical protein PF005_g1656 [Phytophthora fragariae]|uniref:Uncharacterized protein n=1 Tax=Phytophthora fragariae TaxID=53985 RepID=A0A6A3T464_9STRA|nr:hypothetical protein PF003_g35115 [Phytophthora fragariae]KAE8948707.1 hypothetical protein PF009_g1711 [Phytophthora fragariae]KAE9021742.1 hypothetical protein PF011_g4798 [Phytophthora fragariae]KAE9128952.1 hypothetical protein PF007_g5088 [Phytophthora fragariae]KAE9138337.1 hypothetical protein PF010_g990 [Phytophthora fragariae]
MLGAGTPPTEKKKKLRKPRAKNTAASQKETDADPVLYESGGVSQGY